MDAQKMAYDHMLKKPLGEGSRFKAVEASAAAGGARNPAAVAAMVGRRKYGKKRFAKLAAKGRHDAAEERNEPKGLEEKE